MSFLDELDELTKRERQRLADDERQKASDERLDRLEAGQKTILDALTAQQNPPERSSSGGNGDDPDPDADRAEGSGSSASDDDTDDEPELPLERVSKMDVPRIWAGDDEPASVKYQDADTGEEKTRKGRKKGQPYGWNVEDVDEPEEKTA